MVRWHPMFLVLICLDISGWSFTIQRSAQIQRCLVLNVFSIKMGASEMTRWFRWHLVPVKGSVLGVTLWMQRSLKLSRLCCPYLMSQRRGMRIDRKSLSTNVPAGIATWVGSSPLKLIVHLSKSNQRNFNCCITPRDKVAEELIQVNALSWRILYPWLLST
jgi:hypothetical protein